MDSSNIFTVTPMSQQIELEAGQTYVGYVTVANPANASADFKYQVNVSPYSVINEEYTADLMSQTDRSQISKWITIPEPTGVLKPNESRDVEFVVNVPENAPAGGQYATIMISSAPQSTSNDGVNVKNIFEIASIVYAKVEGETTYAGEILDNNIPGFATTIPIQVSTTIRNDSNVHETARISLEVKSFFAASPIYPKAGESGTVQEIIMPETTRYFTRDIDGIAPLGIYEVTQTVNFLNNSSINRQTVVVCPIWFMALVIVSVAAIIVAIVKAIKTHRRKKIVL